MLKPELSSLAELDRDEDDFEDESEEEVSVLGVFLLGAVEVLLSGVDSAGCCAAGGLFPWLP